MGEIGSGNNSSYPGELDTNSIPEVNSPAVGKTKARKEPIEDLTDAMIKVETELGTDPAGSLTNVKTFLQTQHQTDGTHKNTHGPHKWIDAADYSTFTDAINAAIGKTLFISSSITLEAGAINIPATVLGVYPLAPGVISKGSATSFTINGPVVGNPMHQWLSGFAAGEVTFGDGIVEYFRPQWWGLSLSASATTNTLAMHCAAAAANAIGGGVVKVPSGGSFALSQFTFGSMSNVIIEGSSQGYNYGSAKSSSDFTVTTGVWGIRFPVTSAYCELRNINVSSNGSLSDTYPHTIITAGVEYGILLETASGILDSVTSYGFQYGCVQADYGQTNIYEKCAFVWNTKVGFASTKGSAACYAAYHPNLIAPSDLMNATVFTFRNCTIRRNGWGMIIRDGAPIFEGINIIESNHFGGIIAYVGSLDSGCSISGRLYLENNWLSYNTNINSTSDAINVNNLLKETASTWMSWTHSTNTALNDAGYQLYAMAATGGTTQDPGQSNFYEMRMVNSGTGVTNGKGLYLKQSYLWTFWDSSCTGGDQTNAVKLGDGTGGFYANATLFWNFNGTLPATLGNRGAVIDRDRSFSGGLRMTNGTISSDTTFGLIDGVTAPSTITSLAQIYIDSADGDLKIKFGDGVIKTIVVDV